MDRLRGTCASPTNRLTIPPFMLLAFRVAFAGALAGGITARIVSALL